jgi:thiol-disulfide isomerase/thioredoxin
VSEGKLAPDFEAPSPEGGRVRLSDLRGRAVLINFWATWCGSCLSEMPEIAELQKEKGDAAFAVLAVNAGEDLADAMEFIDFLDAPFNYVLDRDLVVSDAYGVYGLPLSVFVDAGGIVRGIYNGHADRLRLSALTDAAIASRPAAELPPSIRLVSTIPRERVLTISRPGEGRVVIGGRSLRCDGSFCADVWLGSLAKMPGVRVVELPPAGESEPALSIDFDPERVGEEQILRAVIEALEFATDPLYTGPIQLRDLS